MSVDKKLLLEISLHEIWNNRNSEERLEKMKAIYAEDLKFFESEDDSPIVGFQKINQIIGDLQSQWPSTFQFKDAKPVRKNNDIQVASWTLGTPGESPAATGMDIAIIENGKIRSLYLLLDK